MKEMNAYLFPVLLLLLEGKFGFAASPLQVLHSFKTVKFVEGNSGEYIGKNVVIIDVDVWKESAPNGTAVQKIFVTTPRAKPGVTASLSVLKADGTSDALLSPYPSWEANKATCDNIVSAFRVAIDSCNRLWVLDSGYIDVFTAGSNKLCPPKILIYDLKTDTLISKHEFPEEVLKPESLFTTIVVDVRDDKCNEAYAYTADPNTYQIVTFSLKELDFWNYRNRFVYPYPLDGSFKVNGVTFDFMDGVIGLALGPVVKDDRTVYLHSLASRRESYVQAKVLRDPSLAGDLEASVQKFQVSPGERTSQSAAEAMSGNVLFFNLLGENSIACWPASTPYTKSNIRKLVKDEEIIQFVSGLKVKDKELWFVSSTLPKYFSGDLDQNKINFRIVKASIEKLTKGSNCRRR